MRTLTFLPLFFVFLTSLSAQNYLSNLSADKNDPLFTTYAAAIERSEFILDQGYQFRWFEENESIHFLTDKGGSVDFIWKMNDDIRYSLSGYNSEPVVTLSYPDMLSYFYYPYENIRVDVDFLVYSSRIAYYNITVTNESSDSALVDFYPFMVNEDQYYTPGVLQNGKGLNFIHEEEPDWWVLGHGVPYQQWQGDVFLMDEAIDSYGAFTDFGNYAAKNNSGLSSAAANYCVEWGLVHTSQGSPCIDAPPEARQLIFLNGSEAEVLTEDAPKWGDPDPNIPGNGWQGCELGNFLDTPIAAGDTVTVIFTSLPINEQGINTGIVPPLPAPGGVNIPIQLDTTPFPDIPQNFDVSIGTDSTIASVTWNAETGLEYLLYRRSQSTLGRYSLLTTTTGGSYTDNSRHLDSLYAYILVAKDGAGRYSAHTLEEGDALGARNEFLDDLAYDTLSQIIPIGNISIIALQKKLSLPPGASENITLIRGVTEDSVTAAFVTDCENALSLDYDQFLNANEQLFSDIPSYQSDNPDYEMMYWNAFSLIRQNMLPPENECSYNYYVFSREPQWGWGHGGQVFHESLVMLAYAHMDPVSAMNSQRVFIERQHNDGYINYRTGPYLNEQIPHNGQLTTSAPWFNWINSEIYKIHPDAQFLQEAYESGKDFYNYWRNNRDADGDSLCEWGAHAVLECVRDGQVAVWDQVGWPSNFECIDLNAMLVQEAEALAYMAGELGLTQEQNEWLYEQNIRKERINQTFWDDETGFYYFVDKDDNDFTYNSSNDLKRMEMTGFLPLWAGIANQQQAERLIAHLTNTDKFWRPYGIPGLAADDSYYNPTGYWNGPIWVQWQYLIFRGLIRYGYISEAEELADKVLANVINRLQADHVFWELYSPDANWGGWNKTYIWTGIVARMLLDLQDITGIDNRKSLEKIPSVYQLYQNYPNPFNPSTTIKFSLPERSEVNLTVYDIMGTEIATLINETLEKGTYTIDFTPQNIASGVYFYRLSTTGFSAERKLIYLK